MQALNGFGITYFLAFGRAERDSFSFLGFCFPALREYNSFNGFGVRRRSREDIYENGR